MAPVRGDLSGRPERDECYATAAEEVLALERRYDTRANLINIGLDRSLKDSVDGALQEENERVGELLLKVGQPLLTEHGEVEAGQEDEAAGSEEASTEELHLPLQSETAAAGEEAWNESVSMTAVPGEEEGRPLAAFIQSITARIEDTVLGTPAPGTVRPKAGEDLPVRRSARFAKGPNVGVPIETLARQAVARRLGSLPPDVGFSERLLQAYLALFDGPLSDMAVKAIEDLVLTVKKAKKKIPVLGAGVEPRTAPLIAA